MSRSARLFELVHLLSGRRSRGVAELAERFEVSERTVYRDLAELSERHIPLISDEHGYRLLETATLRPLNLTAEEHAMLKVALRNPVLQHQPGLRVALNALEAKLDAATAHAEETVLALQLAGVDRSGPGAEKAIEPLRKAVKARRSVAFRYQSLTHLKVGGGRPRWRRVDPYQIFQRDGAWYLVGQCHEHGEPRVFRLDRMNGVKLLDESFRRPADFDLERFLESAWSLAPGREDFEIVLHFDSGLGPLLLNARHHPGEKVRKLQEGTVEYRVKLSSVDEIARWIVTFGGRARVIDPPELRAKVCELAAGILERH